MSTSTLIGVPISEELVLEILAKEYPTKMQIIETVKTGIDAIGASYGFYDIDALKEEYVRAASDLQFLTGDQDRIKLYNGLVIIFTSRKEIRTVKSRTEKTLVEDDIFAIIGFNTIPTKYTDGIPSYGLASAMDFNMVARQIIKEDTKLWTKILTLEPQRYNIITR